jgi:hypothetical protein
MTKESFIYIRVASGIMFFVMLYVAYYMNKHKATLFGKVQHETSGERAYSLVTPFIIIAHIIVGFALIALGVH